MESPWSTPTQSEIGDAEVGKYSYSDLGWELWSKFTWNVNVISRFTTCVNHYIRVNDNFLYFSWFYANEKLAIFMWFQVKPYFVLLLNLVIWKFVIIIHHAYGNFVIFLIFRFLCEINLGESRSSNPEIFPF